MLQPLPVVARRAGSKLIAIPSHLPFSAMGRVLFFLTAAAFSQAERVLEGQVRGVFLAGFETALD
jgi:hypothetical protein